MILSQENSDKILICRKSTKAYTRKPDTGYFEAIVEVINGEYKPIEPSDLPHNGLIHITKGYDRYIDDALYKTTATVSNVWRYSDNPDGLRDVSKYVSYDASIEKLRYLGLSNLLIGDFPDPSVDTNLSCKSKTLPIDGFFIRCTAPSNETVIVGPLDKRKDIQAKLDENGYYDIHYSAHEANLSGRWSDLNGIPHSTLIIPVELIPNHCLIENSGAAFLAPDETIPFEASTLLDLSTNDQIISWAAKQFRFTKPEAKKDLSALKAILEDLPTDKKIPDIVNQQRKERLDTLYKRASNDEQFGSVVLDYLSSPEGKDHIEKYVGQNRDNLLQQYHEDNYERTKNRMISQVQEDLERLGLQKLALEMDISSLQDSVAGQEKLELEKIREEKNIIFNYEELTVSKKILSNEILELEQEKKNADQLLNEIQYTINQGQEKHKLKLIELRMELDALSGIVQSSAHRKKIIHNIQFSKISGDSKIEKQDAVITLIHSFLKSKKRDTSKEEIAILLCSVLQNLIVTFAGKPGTGKTSSAIALAEALGLIKQNKFAHIQVQRGWSSDKDILGFYNKLTRCYDRDRYGLYDLILGLQELEHRNQLSIALLDEANLSPIEHYWSSFMGACDSPSTFTAQSEADEKQLGLPIGLRFIATINYDRTTEPLSARFIDRSPIISLKLEKAESTLLSENENSSPLNLDPLNLDMTEIENIFSANVRFSDDERRIFEGILNDHKFISIQRRKIEAVQKLTSSLREFLAHNGEALDAFDNAILIHILPMISGQGPEYARSLNSFYDDLKNKWSGLRRSRARVEEIISAGRFETYSFFS